MNEAEQVALLRGQGQCGFVSAIRDGGNELYARTTQTRVACILPVGHSDRVHEKDRAVAVVMRGEASWHAGAGWYYVEDEYREGSVGAFKTEEDALKHALAAGYTVPPGLKHALREDATELLALPEVDTDAMVVTLTRDVKIGMSDLNRFTAAGGRIHPNGYTVFVDDDSKGTEKAPDVGETSDGYHTFNELYDHRHTLFLALCRVMSFGDRDVVWRSQLHSDCSKLEGWFIMGIGTEPGMQISYHLPLARWTEADFAATYDRAPEFDGHTSADVLKRLRKLYQF